MCPRFIGALLHNPRFPGHVPILSQRSKYPPADVCASAEKDRGKQKYRVLRDVQATIQKVQVEVKKWKHAHAMGSAVTKYYYRNSAWLDKSFEEIRTVVKMKET